MSSADRPTSLAELASLFLRLGVTAFGGPAAHIALMEEEVVRRRRWLTHQEFLDMLGATNLIPGPNSTELAIHIGRSRAGTPGLIVAGAAFIIPAMCIVLGCAWAYVKYGRLPQVQGILYGVKPVILAIIGQALWSLTKSAVKNKWLAILALAAVIAGFVGINELLILLIAGLIVPIARRLIAGPTKQIAGFALRTGVFAAASGAATTVGAAGLASAAAPFSLSALFWFFLKVGSVLFGSGYVLLAFLRADLVDRWHWLTEAQLLDSIAVGQVTPGPVFTTATFIGYVLGGVPGALLATLGIFLPAFVFVALSAPFIPRLRQSPIASGFLDGVNVASLALMVVVSWYLARSAVIDIWTALLALLSLILVLKFRINSTWLVVGGALIGWLMTRLA